MSQTQFVFGPLDFLAHSQAIPVFKRAWAGTGPAQRLRRHHERPGRRRRHRAEAAYRQARPTIGGTGLKSAAGQPLNTPSPRKPAAMSTAALPPTSTAATNLGHRADAAGRGAAAPPNSGQHGPRIEVSPAQHVRARTSPTVFSAAGLARAAQPAPRGVPPARIDIGETGVRAGLLARSSVTSDTFAIDYELVTRDGDHVQIHLATSDVREAEAIVASDDATGQFLSYSASTRHVREASLQVTGTLDDGELAALELVARQVAGAARDFLTKDGEVALARAAAIDFHSDEFTSFSLSLTQRLTVDEREVALDHATEGVSRTRASDPALAGFARLGTALRALIEAPDERVDAATRARIAHALVPRLLRPVETGPEAA